MHLCKPWFPTLIPASSKESWALVHRFRNRNSYIKWRKFPKSCWRNHWCCNWWLTSNCKWGICGACVYWGSNRFILWRGWYWAYWGWLFPLNDCCIVRIPRTIGSAVEHHIDIVGVTGSIPVSSTSIDIHHIERSNPSVTTSLLASSVLPSIQLIHALNL